MGVVRYLPSGADNGEGHEGTLADTAAIHHPARTAPVALNATAFRPDIHLLPVECGGDRPGVPPDSQPMREERQLAKRIFSGLLCWLRLYGSPSSWLIE